jgi:hypothetical protein
MQRYVENYLKDKTDTRGTNLSNILHMLKYEKIDVIDGVFGTFDIENAMELQSSYEKVPVLATCVEYWYLRRGTIPPSWVLDSRTVANPPYISKYATGETLFRCCQACLCHNVITETRNLDVL